MTGNAEDDVLAEAFRVYICLWSHIRMMRLWCAVNRSNKEKLALWCWLRGGMRTALRQPYGGLLGFLALLGAVVCTLCPGPKT